MELPPPAPGAPGMFRCAQNGLMEEIFYNAGLKNVSVKEVNLKLNCGTADTYWSVMTELAAPVVAALSKADEETRTKIRRDVYQSLAEKYPSGTVLISASALVISGEK